MMVMKGTVLGNGEPLFKAGHFVSQYHDQIDALPVILYGEGRHRQHSFLRL